MGLAQKRGSASSGDHKGLRGRVSETGRLSLPAEVRREVGLERGGAVRIEVVDGAIRIRTMRDVKDRIRALARKTGLADKASVADFLAFREDEHRREAAASTKGRK